MHPNTGNFRYSLANGTTTEFSVAGRHPTHMWMADPHVISALREKRALVSGLIEKLERKLEQQRADLTHIDGVLRLFQPDRDPGDIKPKRTYARRPRYFARNELSRLVMDILRATDGLKTTDEIAAQVIEAKVFDSADFGPAQSARRAMSRSNAVVQKTGSRRPDRVRTRSEVEAGRRLAGLAFRGMLLAGQGASPARRFWPFPDPRDVDFTRNRSGCHHDLLAQSAIDWPQHGRVQ